MIDLRNCYRAVSPKNDSLWWEVQVRCWWSPFWSYATTGEGVLGARDAAWRHANPHKQMVVKFGPLKGEPKSPPQHQEDAQ